MNDITFLTFLRNRLINVYNESPNVDFVTRLDEVIERTRKAEKFVDEIRYNLGKYDIP